MPFARLRCLSSVWVALVLLSGCASKVVEYPAAPIEPRSQAPTLYLPPQAQEYRLQVGDGLAIRSYFDSQLNQDVVVRTDGRITVMLIGEMPVSGMTPRELTQQIRGRYQAVVGSTDLVVAVTRSAGMNVFLGGELKSPAMLPLDGPVTLMQAIARAGGVLPSAYVGSVLIVRNQEDGDIQVRKVDIDRILRGEAADPYLQPKDVVHVPKSPIAQVGLFVEQYINAIVPSAVQLQLGWFTSRVNNRNPVIQVTAP